MSEPMSYVGKAPCGCIRFAAVDLPEMERDIRKGVMDCLANGLTVERMDTASVRAAKWGCPACSKKQSQRQLPGAVE